MKGKFVTRSFLKVIRENIGLDLLLLLAVFGVIIGSLIPPQILKTIIDSNLVPHKQEGLLNSAVLYLTVLLVIGLSDFLKEAILTVAGQKITTGIRLAMMEKMGRIDARFFSQNETGMVVSRFTNDVDAVQTIFTSGIVGMFIDLLKMVGIVFSIWQFSTNLGLIALGLLPVLFVLTRIFQKKMLSAQIRSRVIISWINNHIAESVKNIQMIKSFSKEAYMEKRYEGYLTKNYRTVEEINFVNSIYPPMIQIIRSLVIAGIILLSAGKIQLSGLSLGMVAASIELISNLFVPVETLGMELQNVQESMAGIRRVNDFFEIEEEDPKNLDLTAAQVIPDSGRAIITFENVSFAYDEDTKVLEDINLTIQAQESVTFIGRTGVGKTTLFRLVMGLIRPTKGRIAINGIDVADIPHTGKRRLFGYVEQDFHMIDGTVGEQIGLKDPSVSREQIERALRLVGLEEYVAALENGIDTDISLGTVFSQGQKQLLAIARAVAANPPVLLLDEMTANLDSITEGKIVAALQKVSANHTILSISHRLSSMIASDTIVILENGRIKSAGSPEMLLETDEWYRKHMELEKLTWS